MSSYLGFQPTTFPPYYFVSYGSDDAARVGPVVCVLSKKLPLWYDYGLAYGEDWKKNIADHIENAEGVLLFLSKTVLAKGNDSYVYTEYEMAKAFFNKPIIIIQIDSITKTDIPNELLGWWIELNRYQNIICDTHTTDESLADLIYNAVIKDETTRSVAQNTIPVLQDPLKQQPFDISISLASLLKRAFIYLEDGEWQRADEYFERILDLDPENAQAYVGKLMAALQVHQQGELMNCDQPFDEMYNFRKAVQFGDDKLKDTLNGYITYINNRNETARLTELYNRAIHIMNTANTADQFASAAGIFRSIAGFQDADVLAAQAEASQKDAIYKSARVERNKNTIAGYKSAIQLFCRITDWKDSNAQIAFCKQRIEKLEAAHREREEKEIATRIAVEKETKENQKSIVFQLILYFAMFLIILLLFKLG